MPDPTARCPDAHAAVSHGYLAAPDARHPAPDAPDAHLPAPDGGVLGRVLGRGRAEYPVLVPSAGRAESIPADWWQSTGRAVRQALAQARDAEIVAVAVAGQMHGVVLPSGPGPGEAGRSCGSTSAPPLEADRYAELPASLTGGLGNRPSAGMAGPILCWLAEHEPDNVAAARWALQPKDWIRLQMTGRGRDRPDRRLRHAPVRPEKGRLGR